MTFGQVAMQLRYPLETTGLKAAQHATQSFFRLCAPHVESLKSRVPSGESQYPNAANAPMPTAATPIAN